MDSRKVKREIIQPYDERSLPLYICGEAYSDAQGWVEGALQTADMMLEKWFDVPALSGEAGKKPAHKAAKGGA